MGTYILRRLITMVPTLFGVSVLLFVIFNVVGDDPVYLYLGRSATEAEIQVLRSEMGLDKPLYMQYLAGMRDFLTFDWGFSMSAKKPIMEMFREGVGPSLAITFPALLLYSIVSIVLGLVTAYWRGTWIDKAIVISATIGMSISYVAVMIFGQYFLAFLPFKWWGVEIFPITGWEPPYIRYILLPNLISTFVALGYDTRFFRSVAVEEMGKDYIRTAKAYGADTRTILFKHVLKNILIPVIARVIVTFPFLIAGSFLLESFFVIPGLGYKLLHAIQSADYPVIKTFTLVIAFLVVITNALADVLNSLVDPRVKLS